MLRLLAPYVAVFIAASMSVLAYAAFLWGLLPSHRIAAPATSIGGLVNVMVFWLAVVAGTLYPLRFRQVMAVQPFNIWAVSRATVQRAWHLVHVLVGLAAVGLILSAGHLIAMYRLPDLVMLGLGGALREDKKVNSSVSDQQESI